MIDDYKDVQPVACELIKNSIQNKKISHAYLIETLGNDYGLDFAKAFAKVLLCPNNYFNKEKCNKCSQCQTIDDNNFIELEVIDTDEIWIKKEKVDLLQKNFNFKPVIGKRKIYIINNADKMRENVANKLLKFIEEPAEGITAILITDNKEKIIDTIISRCQIINLKSSYDESNSNILLKYNKEIVSAAVDFINYYESNGVNTIIYTNDLLHSKLKDRYDYIVAFEIIIMYYSDIINYKLNHELLLFEDYKLKIEELKSISFEEILKKMDILVNLKNYIYNNVNLNLLIDKLIIDFEKVK